MNKQELQKALDKSCITKQLREDIIFLRDLDRDEPQGIFEIDLYNIGVIRGIQQERKRRATKKAE